MEFDTTTTAVVFFVIVGASVGGLLAAPMMTPTTVLTMVLPSVVIFGLITLALGVQYGEYRARR
ncbi:hypothetical protein RYH80_06725 [Halobaculum sp. MBLA0147]|uniref:DUF7333 family protein n=1 Tax=Halobaculum sp. MBLA0147 TaxID=3079934 RepID=UPI00352597CC